MSLPFSTDKRPDHRAARRACSKCDCQGPASCKNRSVTITSHVGASIYAHRRRRVTRARTRAIQNAVGDGASACSSGCSGGFPRRRRGVARPRRCDGFTIFSTGGVVGRQGYPSPRQSGAPPPGLSDDGCVRWHFLVRIRLSQLHVAFSAHCVCSRLTDRLTTGWSTTTTTTTMSASSLVAR